MSSLGRKLKEARGLVPMTLRQVEEATGISNAYLSQLENDKIKQPAVSILHKLALLYRVDFNSLLATAGVIQENNEEATEKSDLLKHIAFYAEHLTEEEEKEVLEYIKFLQYKKKNNG